MKKFLIATAALASIALVGPANAADLPVKAPPMVMPALYNWTGLYVGVEGGGVMGQNSDWLIEPGCPGFAISSVCENVGHPLHGGFVGGEAGFNWQSGRWVFGIEGDGNWAELEEALTCPSYNVIIVGVNCGSRIRDFETVRARIGYAFGPTGSFLVYVTGGWATASQSALLTVLGPPFVADEQFLRHNGFAVGGGAEYGITPWLSLKGEVIYVSLEGRDHCIPPACTSPIEFGLSVRVKDDFVLARMGLNARFWWGKGPVAVVARY